MEAQPEAAEAPSSVVDARPASPASEPVPTLKGEPGVLTLLGFQPAPDIGLDDVSPFVIKVLTYLKLQRGQFKYHYLTAAQHGMKGLPRGKLPCLQLEDGSVVPDSANIIHTLEARLPESLRLDRDLSEVQRAQGVVLRRMVEESFYWTALIHTRWADDQGWAVTKKQYFGHVPGFFKMFLGLLRKNVVSAYKGQGHGRRPASEVVSLAKEELDAMATLLGDQSFFLGTSHPTTVDCTLYAFLASVSLDGAWYTSCPIRQHLQSKPSLLSYLSRMQALLCPKTDSNNDSNNNPTTT